MRPPGRNWLPVMEWKRLGHHSRLNWAFPARCAKHKRRTRLIVTPSCSENLSRRNTMLRIVKITMFVCLITPLALAGAALAQGTAHQSFVVMAGGGSIAQVDVMDFAPHTLKIHRGDSVTWFITGFHDVDFNSQAQPLVIAPAVNGKPTPQLNPDVVFPNIPA